MSLVDVEGGGGTKNKAPPERSVLPSGGNAQNDLMGHIGSMMDAQCAQERFRGTLTP